MVLNWQSCTQVNQLAVKTKEGHHVSEGIQFCKDLPKGDALCLTLFTLCINSIAWKLKASEGYKISKPISMKIPDLLYIDDLKILTSSEGKMGRVLRSTKTAMENVGL